MYTIKKQQINDAEKIHINNALWLDNGYCPEVYAQIVRDDEAFYVRFTVFEKNPKVTKTKHFNPVHEDSCVEFFAKFMPEKSDYYINFEVNAGGIMNAAYRTGRNDEKHLTEAEVESFLIKTEIFDNYWTAAYKIPFDFIGKYYPGFNIAGCKYILANLYKCGDKTKFEHYITAYEVKTPTPDFHRPEYFQKIEIE